MTKLGKFIITSLTFSTLGMGSVYLLTDIVGIWYMYSAVITSAILAALSFSVNYLWTWRIKGGELKTVITSRFIKYVVVGGSITLIVWSLLYALTEFMHLWYILSYVICWIVGMTIAFLVNNSWTYKKA